MVEAYNYDGTMSLNDVRREASEKSEALQNQIDIIANRLNDVSNTVSSQPTNTNFSGIVNILDNSLPEWSKAAYDATGVNPSDGGDANLECKNFYRDIQPQDSLTVDSAHALKAAKTSEPADHSLWAGNESTHDDIPRWNKPSCWIEIGGVTDRYDIYYPIPNDIIFPGQRFTFQFEALLAGTDPLPTGLQFYAGFFDSTPSQKKYIEGGAFTITGQIFGIPGGLAVDYQVLARTDSGEEAISQVLHFANAPAVFDQNNHPRITFSGVAGFIEFEIYRKIGSDYVLQFTVRNSIDGTYFDIGNPPEAHVPGFPSITTTAPRAYAVTTNFVAGTLFGLGFVRNALVILVPTTYVRNQTASGQQYLRFGLTGLTTTARQIYIRKLGLSMGDGNWARSGNDTNAVPGHSTPSGSAATGSPPSGGGGDGGGVDDPPPPGGGSCVVLDTPIRMANGELPFKELKKATENGHWIDAGGPVYRPVRGVKIGHASTIYKLRTENGCGVSCTADEPFITSSNDLSGTPLSHLKERWDKGETVMILTKPFDEVVRSKIVSIEVKYGSFTVGEPTVDGGIFIAGGCLLHNKPILEGSLT